MEKEKVYEIASIMSDNQLFKGDVNVAAGMVRSMFAEKYITPIQKAIEKENAKSRKNPNKEARLLAALKPFVASHAHKKLDEVVDAIHMLETMKGLKGHLPAPKAVQAQNIPQPEGPPKDPSVHTDGIYDIDQDCMKNRTNPLIPFFMAIYLTSLK